ncbi:MAG: HAD family hydrolase [Pseudomonadota bacterium]
MRIAMWSGPRNLSTAMMYSFGARSDFRVMDEPFYACYLSATGADHPMRAEILAAHETDPAKVNAFCQGAGAPHLYMKHMPHHMVDGFPMDWAEGCVHVHLIRHPARVIASYAAKRERVTLDDLGFAQQRRIYTQLGGIVIDSADVRAAPEKTLRRLCDAIGLRFDPAMLRWSAGARAEDGAWAKHWYGAVHKSTRFSGAEGSLPKLEPEMVPLLKAASLVYEEMAACKL